MNVQTIRYYEREKLLPVPHRWRDNNYRDFDDEALQRLRFIRSAKELGFALREIRELLDLRILPGESCQEVQKLVGTKIGEIDKRMKEMRRLRRILFKLLAACRRPKTAKTCPVLWAIEH